MNETMHLTLKPQWETMPNADSRICIPVKKCADNSGYQLSRRFTSAEHYFLIDFLYKKVDLLKKEEISGLMNANDGTGMINLKIDAVICIQVFPMAHKILDKMGIKVYKSVGDELVFNIEKYLNNALIQMKDVVETSDSSCTSSCASCATTCNV